MVELPFGNQKKLRLARSAVTTPLCVFAQWCGWQSASSLQTIPWESPVRPVERESHGFSRSENVRLERNFQAFSEFDQKSKKYETAKPALIWIENPDYCLVKA